MSADRPIIAVSARPVPIGRVQGWLEPALAGPTYYLEAISRAGGVGVQVLPEPIDGDQAAALMARLDGLVLTGGPDVDPSLYGQEAAPETYETSTEVDEFEMALLRAAIDAAKPVLAICKGHQLLNVAYGGTLDQHITGRPGLEAHGVPNGGGGALVAYEIEPGSALAKAAGATTASGMCHHHQAIDEVGAGLRVVARCADGTVEAVEPVDAPGWVVSVQWHPEDSAARDPQQQALFDTLVAEARRA
jgi:putative glutamine amidotransferase